MQGRRRSRARGCHSCELNVSRHMSRSSAADHDNYFDDYNNYDNNTQSDYDEQDKRGFGPKAEDEEGHEEFYGLLNVPRDVCIAAHSYFVHG